MKSNVQNVSNQFENKIIIYTLSNAPMINNKDLVLKKTALMTFLPQSRMNNQMKISCLSSKIL